MASLQNDHLLNGHQNAVSYGNITRFSILQLSMM